MSYGRPNNPLNIIGFGPNAGVMFPAEQEPTMVPASEIVLGQDGNLEYRQNIAQLDGTYAVSPSPGQGQTNVERW
jgi:hypothetical protein